MQKSTNYWRTLIVPLDRAFKEGDKSMAEEVVEESQKVLTSIENVLTQARKVIRKDKESHKVSLEDTPRPESEVKFLEPTKQILQTQLHTSQVAPHEEEKVAPAVKNPAASHAENDKQKMNKNYQNKENLDNVKQKFRFIKNGSSVSESSLQMSPIKSIKLVKPTEPLSSEGSSMELSASEAYQTPEQKTEEVIDRQLDSESRKVEILNGIASEVSSYVTEAEILHDLNELQKEQLLKQLVEISIGSGLIDLDDPKVAQVEEAKEITRLSIAAVQEHPLLLELMKGDPQNQLIEAGELDAQARTSLRPSSDGVLWGCTEQFFDFATATGETPVPPVMVDTVVNAIIENFANNTEAIIKQRESPEKLNNINAAEQVENQDNSADHSFNFGQVEK